MGSFSGTTIYNWIDRICEYENNTMNETKQMDLPNEYCNYNEINYEKRWEGAVFQ